MNTDKTTEPKPNFFSRLFGCKKRETPVPELPAGHEDWQRVRTAFPVGKRFEYLGRELLVTSHEWQSGWPGCFPTIATEYADNNGKLHEWHFTPQMFGVLEAPNEKLCGGAPEASK